MLREYENGSNNITRYFIGEEIENTKFKGMQTLFVACAPVLNDIGLILRDHKEVKHVYLGANHYFHNEEPLCHKVISKLLDNGIFVTLDVTYEEYQKFDFLEISQFLNNPNFCVILSIKLPGILEKSAVTLKIDDSGYRSTNPGVWVFGVKDLPSETFNDWESYKNDIPVEPKLL